MSGLPVKMLMVIWTIALLCNIVTGADKQVLMGITRFDGDKYSAEYIKDSKDAAFLAEHGVKSALIDYKALTSLAKLKEYNVIMLRGREEGVHLLTPEIAKQADALGQTLKQYVEQGGSLLLLPQSVRYANDQDEKYWNMVLKPLNLEILHEGVFDLENQTQNEIKPGFYAKFFFTANIKKHPAVGNVSGLWLPLNSYYPAAGTLAMKYGSEWEVIVSGEKSAKSFLTHPSSNELIATPDKTGTYKESPPIIAVRNLGKGRVACLPLDVIYTGQNYGNAFWSHIVESAGEPKSGKKSDGMQLIAGLAKWLGEGNLNNPAFGTAKIPEYKPVQFAESCQHDSYYFPKLADGWWKKSATGILGARTAYTDGTASVADYVKAAKAAGLAYIVFTDPLELLTPQKLDALKAECKKNSDKTFYACPGVEFTDGSGVRWVFWGEKVVWPSGSFKHMNYTYQIWDDSKKVVSNFGKYIELCGYAPSAIIDYKQLSSVGSYMENMWWFFNIFPYAYDGDKLIADNTKELQLSVRDLRFLVPMPYTRIKTPAEVKTARHTALSGIGIGSPEENMANAFKILNARCASSYYQATDVTAFVTYGGYAPAVLRIYNNQMEENWQFASGAQRVKVQIDAYSEAGIKEVKLLDPSSNDVLRRFLPAAGTKIFSQAFELVQDKQHWVILEITDGGGAKSYSNSVLIFCYKQGLFRCGDNLNILGPLGMYWHPDRNQSMHFNKDFRNAELFSVQGWDRGGPDCPGPVAQACDWVNIKGVGEFPSPVDKKKILGKRMDVQLSSHNLQIVDMKMDDLMEKFDNKDRPGPSFASICRKIADNEYFERFDRMIAPMDRMDHYIAWNHRRLAESIRNYKGDYMWHEGSIKFKKDVVLQGNVPIPLGWITMPFNPEKSWGNTLIVKDGDKEASKTEIKEKGNFINKSGQIGGGGYIAVVNNPIGYIGVLVPHGYEMSYNATIPGRLYVGIGKSGQEIKAGTVLKYAYIAANITDDKSNDGQKMAALSRAMDLDGKGPGYPVEVKTGKLLDSTYFLTIQAAGNEAVFTAGPQSDIGIDLPIKIEGIEDNGCAAIYSSSRPWFRFIATLKNTAYFQEPIDKKNDIWAGNVFVSDNKFIKLTLVKDGIAETRDPFLEIHNPTDAPVKARISSPANTPEFGGTSFEVTIPAGSSIVKELKSKIKRNLAVNGSFEKSGGMLKVHADLLIKAGFKLDFKLADWPSQWQINSSTQPCKVTLVSAEDAQDGKRYIRVAAGPESVHINPYFKPVPGDRKYKCTFFARGTPLELDGATYEPKVRFSVYTFKLPEGKWYGGKQYEASELTKDWKEYTFETTKFESDDGIIPAIELTGNCDLDNVRFTEAE